MESPQKTYTERESCNGPREFSAPHLPKISPTPLCEEMEITVRVTFSTHFSLLAKMQTETKTINVPLFNASSYGELKRCFTIHHFPILVSNRIGGFLL